MDRLRDHKKPLNPEPVSEEDFLILPELIIDEPIFMLLVNRGQSLDCRPDGNVT